MAFPDARGSVKQGSDMPIWARIVHENRATIQTGEISTWDISVFDISSPDGDATAVYTDTGALTSDLNNDGSSIFYNTLTTANGWQRDTRGHNFFHLIPASAFTQAGGHTYSIEVVLNRTSRGALKVVWEIKVEPLLAL